MDEVLQRVMKKLGVEIPDYSTEVDPTKDLKLKCDDVLFEWTIQQSSIDEIRDLYNLYCKSKRRKRQDDKKSKVLKK